MICAWLTDKQLRRIEPYFPLSHWVPHVDDRRPPQARVMLGDRGYDADWFGTALIQRGIGPYIPSRANRKVAIRHDKTLYRQRHRIENMFGRPRPSRRMA